MEINEERLTRLADLLYEASMLKQTPRSGFAFLGSGRESVAEHTFGAAIAAYILANMAGADVGKTVLLCLFHDLHEAATGDFNYVNHRYDQCDASRALEDALEGTGLEKQLLSLWHEFEQKESLESRLAHDADQLDMISALRLQESTGNPQATKWLVTAAKRLLTREGAKACSALLSTAPDHWWYDQVDQSWWINRNEKSS